MARRLKTIVKYINEDWPDYEAKIERVFVNTDIKPKGSKIRIPKKGRYGNCLKVRRISDTAVVFQHNAAETYRSNDEVEYWIKRVENGYEPKTLNIGWI